MKMAKQERTEQYFEIVEKVKKIFAGIAEQLSKLSPNELAEVKRGLKLLVRKTPAGAERLAILHLLETHEAVPGTVLYQICSNRVEKRVRELRSMGFDIRRWSETRPDGYSHAVYGWSAFQMWQERRMLTEAEEELLSLRRVM